MKKIIKNLLTILLIGIQVNTYSQELETRISGEIIGRNSKEILLVPIYEDFNNITILLKGITIPIKENKFEYFLKTRNVEAYLLIFKEEAANGGYLIRKFFNDSTNIDVSIYPDSIHHRNSFTGGKLNRIMHEHKSKMYEVLQPLNVTRDSLYKVNKLYTTEYLDLEKEIKNTKDKELRNSLIIKRNSLTENKEMYTPLARYVMIKSDSIWKNEGVWREKYVTNNNDMIAYSFLLEKFERMKELELESLENFNRISKNYINHPYTKIIKDRVKTLNTIKVGGNYIDFAAENIDGESVKLSDYVVGKVALINLWATWCGSCRAKGKSIIPIYKKYKDKGFTVIGIAGVYKKMKDFKIATKKDKYPWLNLIEFNNKNKIWLKYGIASSGGSTFLIDATGKILAISPSVEEVDKILNDLLN